MKYKNEGRERAGGDLLTEATLLLQSSSEVGQVEQVQTPGSAGVKTPGSEKKRTLSVTSEVTTTITSAVRQAATQEPFCGFSYGKGQGHREDVSTNHTL